MMSFDWGIKACLSEQVGFMWEIRGWDGAIPGRESNMKKETEGKIIKMSINRRIDKLCFTHKMKYYIVTKKKKRTDLLQHSRT